MLSPLDDFPYHQISDVIRHVGTSDRNFYDRYYFNCHPSSDELFLVTGMGQYPNLDTTDAFAVVRIRNQQHVVRASRELGADRSDLAVGPFTVEVLEGLKRLRVVLDENDGELAFDLTWEGAIPAQLEPRHLIRAPHGRVTMDGTRLAQTGYWTGTLTVAGTDHQVSGDRWWGSRDRSWGIRPIGEPEPPGIGAAQAHAGFFWLYAPMQFPDFSIVFIIQEQGDGTRLLEEAVRVDAKGVEHLGKPRYDLHFLSGTRRVDTAKLYFSESDLVVDVDVLLPCFLGLGTGYGVEQDWRHGMYHGPLVVQHKTYDVTDPAVQPMLPFGVVDSVARFQCDGAVGHGLFEFACVGRHDPSGFAGLDDMAP